MIRDFPCSAGQNEADVLDFETDIQFPDVHFSAEKMARLSLEIRKNSGAGCCILPFCHTVEAEALGAVINHGDRNSTPRVGEYALSTAEELLNLPYIDFDRGRIARVLKACKMLESVGETVVLEITGPFTVLNSLIDPVKLFRFMRKEPEQADRVFAHIGEIIVGYALKAAENGVKIISYADPTGGVSIVGPKIMRAVTEGFTVPLLDKLDKGLPRDVLINLCPKTAFALADTGCADLHKMETEQGLTYLETCTEAVGSVRFTGQTCIKNTAFHISDGLQYLKLR